LNEVTSLGVRSDGKRLMFAMSFLSAAVRLEGGGLIDRRVFS